METNILSARENNEDTEKRVKDITVETRGRVMNALTGAATITADIGENIILGTSWAAGRVGRLFGTAKKGYTNGAKGMAL